MNNGENWVDMLRGIYIFSTFIRDAEFWGESGRRGEPSFHFFIFFTARARLIQLPAITYFLIMMQCEKKQGSSCCICSHLVILSLSYFWEMHYMTRSKSSIPKERTDFHVNDCLKIVRIHKIPLPLPFLKQSIVKSAKVKREDIFGK